jgi:ABC-type multidrug transport system fused ATPase/permease subunit
MAEEAEEMATLRQTWELLSWCWKEFVHEDSKKIARIMLFTQVASGIVNMVRIWSISLMYNALVIHSLDDLAMAVILFYFFGKVAMFMDKRVSLKREELLILNSGYIDQRVMKMFFDHSLSMHISEDTNLNEANIKKGREYLMKIQTILLFQGFETILRLILPYMAIIVLSYMTGSFLAFLVPPTILIIVFTMASVYLAHSIVRDAGPIDDDWRAYHRYITERFREPERVKNCAKEKYEVGEVSRQYSDVSKKDLAYWCWYIRISYNRNALAEDYVILTMSLAAFQVFFGKMSLGMLSPVYSWSWRIVEALWHIADIEMQINKAIPSIMSLKKSLTLPIGIHISKDPLVIPKGTPLKIEFRNVSYSYISRRKDKSGKDSVSVVPVLKNISFTMEAGEKIALIGPSGAGKTTVMRLLLRYMDPTEGVILVNGIPLIEIELSSWLERFGYVRQQSEMLSGDIGYNIRYGLTDCGKSVTDEEVWDVARPLQIDFGESRLTHGLQTKVGFKGIKLSGGQAQRVMVGAAVMKKPDWLLLDEATASLDSTTEKLVQKGIEHYLPDGRGALFNAHRLSTVRNICTKFIMLNGGDKDGSRVVAIASSFEDLADKSPSFRKQALDQDIAL